MFWNDYSNWNEAEAAWDQKAKELNRSHPLKILNTLPKMAGIAEPNIKAKGLAYLLRNADRKFWRYFFHAPFRYTRRLIHSYLNGRSYKRDGDFFLYGYPSTAAFIEDLARPDTLFLLGFSYCHKPFECPSGRFTDQCIRDPNHPVCRQCFIGKCANAAPPSATLVWIPTIHYIGEKIFELAAAHPKRKIVFLITACEMSLEMFGDWGYMAAIQGIGVRLDGRICNTMRAFELSEKGVKPGLTLVLEPTQRRMLEILGSFR